MRRASRCIVTLALLVATPVAAAAQVRGRVVTEGGEPLPDASVEVWGRAVVWHVTHTDRTGWFSVPDLGSQEITRYVIRFLGLGVEIIQHDEFRDGMTVTMSEEPDFDLPGVTATVSREVCPQDDDPEARRLWTAAARGYNRTTSDRGIGGSYRAETRDVNENLLFADVEESIDADMAMWEAWNAGQRVVRGEIRTLEEVVPSLGYAWDRRLEHPEYFFGRDRHLNWKYAELDTRSANHFASSVFGALHTFSFAPGGDTGTRLRFCPRSRRNAWIWGTLLVGDEGEFVEADWRFETGDPDEDAGGWVQFTAVPDPAGGRPHLVARRGVFHRHSGFEKPFPDLPRWVYRELRAWSGWVVSRTGRRPAARSSNGSRDER